LVPVLLPDGTRFKDDTTAPGYIIHRYRPRIEGLFARIERWTNVPTGEIHWRSITKDNVTTLYGKDNNSRIFDPADLDPDHLKRIKYGNRKPNRNATTWQATDPVQLPNETWMFEVVFDYDQGYYAEDEPDAQVRIFARALIDPPSGSHWPVRQDPFSSYHGGF